jgi:hypothetical protein
MSEDEDRLTRWARLKAESAAPPPAAPAPQPDPDPEAIEALLASLPKVEDIDAATDIRGFLRPGVPQGVRNAALARAWITDPAIRDRVPDAVDYAEDYNAPHTIPGWGAAGAEEVEAVARRYRDPAPAAAVDHSRREAAEAAPASSPDDDGPPADSERLGPASPARPAEEPSCDESSSRARPTRRRHGGALPDQAGASTQQAGGASIDNFDDEV